MILTQEIRERHQQLSPEALRFLEFVMEDPSRQRRLELWNSGLPDWVLSYPYQLQSWPTFLAGEKLREVSEISTGICRLIKSLPERVFEGDPERIASYYGASPAAVQEALAAPSESARALGRGDYIATEAGLQCLEMNLSAQLGGWQLRHWADAYRRSGYLAEFLEREGLELFYRDPFRTLLEHFIEHATGDPEIDGPELNLALIYPPKSWGPYSSDILQSFDQDYREILGSLGREGRLLCTGYPDLHERDGKVFIGKRRVHVVLEYNDLLRPSFILESHKRGQIHLYNGPMTRIWNDKRNLALLSEYQGSGLFDPAEKHFLQTHLPWTRLVTRDFADYQGERVFLPDFIAARRESLVLKQALAARGEAVFIGPSMSPERWRKVLDTALLQETWVVQEHVRSVPYLFQHVTSGSVLHDVVWGLFAFGERFGGGFLRMIPSGRNGVVNSAQGATEGIFFEVMGVVK